ncbi:MAG: hypothetical protein Q4G46_16105, partial [Propionibacteriaceae bacterium]|nr:hypothetical protein [Propionibacteriaceae bacterium]
MDLLFEIVAVEFGRHIEQATHRLDAGWRAEALADPSAIPPRPDGPGRDVGPDVDGVGLLRPEPQQVAGRESAERGSWSGKEKASEGESVPGRLPRRRVETGCDAEEDLVADCSTEEAVCDAGGEGLLAREDAVLGIDERLELDRCCFSVVHAP